VVGVGVVQTLDVPATVLGEADDRVPALVDQSPQVLGRLHVAGVPAAHRDDGDGFPGDGGELPVLLAEPFGLLQ